MAVDLALRKFILELTRLLAVTGTEWLPVQTEGGETVRIRVNDILDLADDLIPAYLNSSPIVAGSPQFQGNPLFSGNPNFSGAPTATTAAVGNNSTRIATTAFVKAAIDAIVAAAPGTLDTLNELAAALGNDANYAATTAAALGNRVRYDVIESRTDTEKGRARTNIGAAAADAVGVESLLINGDHGVSQRRWNTAVSISSGSPQFITDGWRAAVVGACVLSGQRLQASPPPGITDYVRLFTSTADNAIAASDVAYVYQAIEGYRSAVLGYGAANPLSVGFGLWVRSSIAGIFGVSQINGPSNRGIRKTVEITTPNTWTWCPLVFPGDDQGVWDKTTGVGAYLRICLMAGTDNQNAPDVWSASTAASTSAQTNFVATNGNTFDFTGAVLLPGSDLPTAERSRHALRKLETELNICRRRFQMSYQHGVTPGALTFSNALSQRSAAGSSSAAILQHELFPEMRATPTIRWYSPQSGTIDRVRDDSAGADLTVSTTSQTGSKHTGMPNVSTTYVQFNQYSAHYTADADLT